VFSKWSLSIMFPNQNTACISHLSCPCYMPHQSHFLDLITLIIFGEVYRLQSSSLCSLLRLPASSFLLGPNILLSTLFSNTLNLWSSLSVRDQISHSYKTTGTIMFFFIYFNFYVFREETGRQDSEKNGSKHSPNLICS
jgi:hypothetical protein